MGNSENQYQINLGVRQFINEEFERVKRQQNRQHLVLGEVLQARHPEDFPFTFSHLGILYICDHTKDGVFTFEDFRHLALWIQINLPGIQMYEFEAQLQARCVAKMIEDIENKQSETALIKWFMKVLASNHHTKIIKNHEYIVIDAIKTIYQVFNVQLMSDMDIQSFFFLAKKSAEELGYSIQEIIENQEEQEYISLKVCEEFILHFVGGILGILKDIGYSSSELQIK